MSYMDSDNIFLSKLKWYAIVEGGERSLFLSGVEHIHRKAHMFYVYSVVEETFRNEKLSPESPH